MTMTTCCLDQLDSCHNCISVLRKMWSWVPKQAVHIARCGVALLVAVVRVRSPNLEHEGAVDVSPSCPKNHSQPYETMGRSETRWQ